MSTDLCISESFDDIFFFSDPFSPIDIPTVQNQEDETIFYDQIAPPLFSNSPPSHQLQNLSISPKPNSQNHLNFETHISDFSNLEVKIEDSQIMPHSVFDHQSFGPHSYGGTENVAAYMQRSYSSNNFSGENNFLFQPKFDFLMENDNFEKQIVSSSESSCFTNGQMRRVCSAGDLQKLTKVQGTHRLSSSPLGGESSYVEEANFKVGRYSAQERKERIHRYRTKRNQRNFNKTIKYACRKTLADSRPRIRGRFARNDEIVEIPKTANSLNPFEDDDDDSWVFGYNEEEGTVRGGTVFNILGPPAQFQYYMAFHE